MTVCKSIYIAGPFFTDAQRDFIEKFVDKLVKDTYITRDDIYVPHLDGGIANKNITKKQAFEKDLDALYGAELVIAIIDGKDTGTMIEIGIAYEIVNHVIGLYTDTREEINKLNPMILYTIEKDGIFRTVYKAIEKIRKLPLHIRGDY